MTHTQEPQHPPAAASAKGRRRTPALASGRPEWPDPPPSRLERALSALRHCSAGRVVQLNLGPSQFVHEFLGEHGRFSLNFDPFDGMPTPRGARAPAASANPLSVPGPPGVSAPAHDLGWGSTAYLTLVSGKTFGHLRQPPAET